MRRTRTRPPFPAVFLGLQSRKEFFPPSEDRTLGCCGENGAAKIVLVQYLFLPRQQQHLHRPRPVLPPPRGADGEGLPGLKDLRGHEGDDAGRAQRGAGGLRGARGEAPGEQVAAEGGGGQVRGAALHHGGADGGARAGGKNCLILSIAAPIVGGSVAEWSKALVLGTSPKGRGFESHRCHISFLSIATLTCF